MVMLFSSKIEKATALKTVINGSQVFYSRSGCKGATHLVCSIEKLPSLKLKTQPKQFLGSLPLALTLFGVSFQL
jgi:hypothetical protein